MQCLSALLIFRFFLVESRSLTVNFPQEYLALLKDLETDYLLIAFCKPCKSYYFIFFRSFFPKKKGNILFTNCQNVFENCFDRLYLRFSWSR
jgi:hypothetical protein